MRMFNLYIEDDRFTVPRLAFLTAEDERHAQELAKQQLEESPHHVGVEICEGDRVLSRLVRGEHEDRSQA